MAAAAQKAAITRRAVLLTMSMAALATVPQSAADEVENPPNAPNGMGDVDPLLMQALCAHCAAYSDVGRLARKADAVAFGSAGSTADNSALDLAIDVERQLLMSVCAYPARNDAERHDKATYLLGIFDGDEPSSEHVTALLTSMMAGALLQSPSGLLQARSA
jgi:hypothetical protein